MDINSAYNVSEPALISIGPNGIRQLAAGEDQVTDLLLLPEYAPLALNTVLKALPRKANSAMLGRYPCHWGDEMVMVGIDDASYSRIIRAVQQHYQQSGMCISTQSTKPLDKHAGPCRIIPIEQPGALRPLTWSN